MSEQHEPPSASEAHGPDTSPGPREERPDPTMMINQPALQRSQGGIWVVMGGLFMLTALVPFGALAFAGSGRSAPLALASGLLVIALYAALLAVRAAVRRQKLRLRLMAACMLTMAFVALLGMWLCALIEGSAAAG